MQEAAFHIGVSGHRELGDKATRAFISEQIRALLVQYQRQKQELALYSPLAVGADQLFVQTALELGIPVEAVLPCAAYETLYAQGNERETYQRLLHSCQHIHRLPFQDCSDDAYLAAGEWIVDHSDLVMLVWNGRAAKGRGGTADVAGYAWRAHRPFIYIDTIHHTIRSHAPVQAIKTSGTRAAIQAHGSHPERALVLPVSQDDIIMLIETYNLAAGIWQLALPGTKVEAVSPEKLHEQIQRQLCQDIGYRAGQVEKLQDFYSPASENIHHVHAFVAYDLEWEPLEKDTQETIKVHTFTLQEALAATLLDDRCDPETAMLLWIYAARKRRVSLSYSPAERSNP
ncbi:MAG: hypothetical protein WCD86_16065 [Ktedonobacteraceae bacterium]